MRRQIYHIIGIGVAAILAVGAQTALADKDHGAPSGPPSSMHDHGGGRLHDHSTGRFFHEHSRGRLHDHDTGRLWHGHRDSWHDHGFRDRRRSSFFFHFGTSPFYRGYYPYNYYGSPYNYGYDPYYYRRGLGLSVVVPYQYRYTYDSRYYLDPYLGLDCYHYSYDPRCPYPAPLGYAGTVPDPSLPRDSRVHLDGEKLLELGLTAFRAGDYENAARWLRHAAVEQPNDPEVFLLLSQALFAIEQYDEAAGAAQKGMLLTRRPEEWSMVASQYRRYYGNTSDYVQQLRALEDHLRQNPGDPAARFLLGYHYALLGYPNEAMRELDRLLSVAPGDELAQQLRDMTARQLSQEAIPRPSPPEEEPAEEAIPPPPVAPEIELDTGR